MLVSDIETPMTATVVPPFLYIIMLYICIIMLKHPTLAWAVWDMYTSHIQRFLGWFKLVATAAL